MPPPDARRRALEFGCAVLVIGLLAGLAGIATTLLLHGIEHLTYHYSFGSLLDGVDASGHVRRALGPMIGGALAGLGWWLLRRRNQVPKLSATIAAHQPLPRVPMALDAVLQVLVVGAGASLGREGAPRQLAAIFGDAATSRWALTARDREILLSCAAGAGLGAVYGVPLGGALFTISILLRSWHPRVVGTALITSSLGVAVAAPVTHLKHPIDWPDADLSYLFVLLALLIAPLAVGVGVAFTRVTATTKAPSASWVLVPGVAAAGLLTGICSIWWPELPGNGKSILVVSVDSDLTITSALAILALKPVLTALFLRAGAVGGLLTPALATGAAAGSAVALALNQYTDLHVSTAAVALTCAAGVLAITQRAPAFAALFVWELAHPPFWLLAVFAIAAYTAHEIWRRTVRAA
ncbi:MAG TPA: chloride channel protein [Candidatus Limnocylindria bacterium]|nr:chloride channel protein [Candidatus Limnocylindria bacterium]